MTQIKIERQTQRLNFILRTLPHNDETIILYYLGRFFKSIELEEIIDGYSIDRSFDRSINQQALICCSLEIVLSSI